MEILLFSRAAWGLFVERLFTGGADVIGVVPRGGRFAYELLEPGGAFCLDYDETILPPKKFLLPVKETLLTFATYDVRSCRVVSAARPQILMGVHPGDLAAIAMLDKAFAEGESDGAYLARRAATTLIGMHPTVPYRYRFTSSMITDEAYRAADVMLTDLGDGSLAAEIVTDKGRDLLRSAGGQPAPVGTAARIAARRQLPQDATVPAMRGEAMPAFLTDKEDAPVLGRRADKCFSCGSCTLVCPTCYCFDVQDELDLSLKQGRRVRVWDGCLLTGFAVVAGGHQFRRTALDRFRHRIFRKLKYLRERFDLPGCVGCGRCEHACTAHIASPAEIINDLAAEGV